LQVGIPGHFAGHTAPGASPLRSGLAQLGGITPFQQGQNVRFRPDRIRAQFRGLSVLQIGDDGGGSGFPVTGVVKDQNPAA